MAKKVTVHLHIGVTLLALAADAVYNGLRATLTGQDGELKIVDIPSNVDPIIDEGNNLQFVAEFQDVQSGEEVTCTVHALDGNNNQLGTSVSHVTIVNEVPDDNITMYYQPVSLFISV
jgi:hypothetical protein